MFTTIAATALSTLALVSAPAPIAAAETPTANAATSVAQSSEIRVLPMSVGNTNGETAKVSMALPGSCYSGRAEAIRDEENNLWIRAYVKKTGTENCTTTPFEFTQTVKIQSGHAPASGGLTVLDLPQDDPIAIDLYRAADWARTA